MGGEPPERRGLVRREEFGEHGLDGPALRERYGAKVVNRDFDGDPERLTEMDALIAYLQMLGTLVDFSTYQASAPANER